MLTEKLDAFVSKFPLFPFTTRRTRKRLLGYLAFWLSAVRLSAALRVWAFHHPRSLLSLLLLGPWPLPRPPSTYLFSDAAMPGWGAVTTQTGRCIWQSSVAFSTINIYQAEQIALFRAAQLAPVGATIYCDNMACIGALRRSRCPTSLLFRLSVLTAKKALCVVYVPSAFNLADAFTRTLALPW